MTKIIEPKKQSNIFKRPSSETGIWSWITTVDHKKIGIMYGYAAFFFLLIGGIEARHMKHTVVGGGITLNDIICQPATTHGQAARDS